ncbi:hypothetical protein CJ178_27985 [Rhodococcus sp. ACPA4]|uniref:hypothetical protein n=1 Tax=Rhodococcus TaxID=1827 RepID=UPI000BCE13B1|nr:MULTISPECIES: hypothetical protein [Rhodococcus]MDV8068829.1 hypothetical protein [Rhodococcus sp. IEGM 1366]PBC37871.1 hypothetical protein CJ178_27985 [Rhodococcus sp. ACPA4]QXW02192.1 hypothetical protein KYT97_28705 [Rhodococcus globerulus]ROZ43865.1 hypothetical protein EEB13_22515 [Rhodococcus sp. WS3]RZL27104.1 MAG: hypothetical protein EOP31_00895 [Rhodococcus sp. (in: high G+C Gram-positive bacteria)]
MTILEKPVGAAPVDSSGDPTDVLSVIEKPAVQSRDRISWSILAAAVTSWWISTPSLSTAEPSDFGLLFAASPFFVVSIVLSVIGFVVAMYRRNNRSSFAAVIVIALIQRTATLIASDVPLYTWTYKHLGVTDLIQRSHFLARGVDVYNGWPGLFTATAWFSRVTGVPDITIANWFAICAHLLMVVFFYCMGRAWRLDVPTAISATFLFEVLNWVAQDYFAPQSLAMILVLAFLTLVGASRDRPNLVLVMVVIFCAIVVTHQLTPYWMGLIIGALTISRMFRPWWLMFVFGSVAVGFLVYNWDSAGDFAKFSFDLASNAKSNLAGASLTPTPGQSFASLTMRLLTVGLLAASAVTAIIMWRRKLPVFALVIIAFAPLAILAGQGYGGEAIFRVYLYCLVGCCLLLAFPLTWMLRARRVPRTKMIVVAIMLLGATLSSSEAYFGAWFAYLTKPVVVKAASEVLETADPNGVLRALSPAWPDRPTQAYLRLAGVDPKFDIQPEASTLFYGVDFNTDEEYSTFNEHFVAESRATYFAISDQMVFYNWYFGLSPEDALPNLETRMRADPAWHVFLEGNGFVVFERAPSLQKGGDGG